MHWNPSSRSNGFTNPGNGDILSLVEDAHKTIDEQKAKRLQKK